MPEFVDCEEHTGPGPRGDDVCPICQDTIEERTPSVTHIKCGTTFCQECINQWVVQQNEGEFATCPMDRDIIGVDEREEEEPNDDQDEEEYEEEEEEEEGEDEMLVPELLVEAGTLTWRGEFTGYIDNDQEYLEPYTVTMASHKLNEHLAPLIRNIRRCFRIPDDDGPDANIGVPLVVLRGVWAAMFEDRDDTSSLFREEWMYADDLIQDRQARLRLLAGSIDIVTDSEEE
jgi:Ring finger domain